MHENDLARVTQSDATCYTVRNGFAWAHIFVRHGVGETNAGDPRGWVNVSILSDYGSFGYCWSHIGGRPWQKFLREVGFDYAMQKMMGDRFKVPMDLHSAGNKVREIVIDGRRNGSMSKDDARALWDALDYCDDQASFLRDLDEHSSGAMYRNELFYSNWEEANPQAVGFWREIWPHFLDVIDPPATAVAA